MQVFTGTFNKDIQLHCTNCNLNLASEDQYKSHYKSQFHRYNIKRKMLGLIAATAEQFADKKTQTAPHAQGLPQSFTCSPCRKTFTNQGVYTQHLESKKHTQISKQTTPLVKNKRESRRTCNELCLFCDCKLQNVDGNLKHMEREHGFFIHQKEFCKDIPGLMGYLHQKIEVGLLCIFCDNKGYKDFQSGEAVRSHMKDKSHCFMNTSVGFQQYEKYFDFSALFDERVADQKRYKYIPGLQKQVVEVQQTPDQVPKQCKFTDDGEPIQNEDSKESGSQVEQGGDDEGEEWSDVESEGDAQNQQPGLKTKKYVFYKPSVLESGELLLPNGKLLGNRKYNHLYKQYYRQPKSNPNSRAMIGGISTALLLKSERLQMFQEQDKQFLRNKLFEKKQDLKLRLSQNMLQYHFRVQNPK